MKTKSTALKGTTPLDHAKGQILSQIALLAEQPLDDVTMGAVTPFERGRIMTEGEGKKVIKHYRKIYNSLAVNWGGDEGFDVDAEVEA
tara:strand:- start:39 stop:302 length:264 start_codon:yes stop_codon:yes gene_type:complete